MWLLAIMEVSAHTVLLGDKPRSGSRGHQFSHAPGRPLLHFFLSLSQTSVGNGCATCCRCPFLLFDRAAGFLPPRPREGEAVARRCCQGWPLLLAATVRLGLDGIEHDGTLARSGPSSGGLGGCFCHLPYFEVAPVMEHAPGDAR